MAVIRNLADAMYHFSELELECLFWIDTICINQAHVVERNSQVIMMGEIYASAHEILVWLGKEDQYSSGVNVFIGEALPEIGEMIRSNIADTVFSLGYPSPSMYDSRKNPEQAFEVVRARLSGFFERTWFARVWTFQESLLARELVVYCGETELSWDLLCEVLRFLTRGDWTSALSRTQKPNWQKSEQMVSTLTQQRLRWLNQDSF